MKEINLGHILIENRHKRGITQDELASYIGVSKAAVSKWETGTTYPDITLLPQLSMGRTYSIAVWGGSNSFSQYPHIGRLFASRLWYSYELQLRMDWGIFRL